MSQKVKSRKSKVNAVASAFELADSGLGPKHFKTSNQLIRVLDIKTL